MVDREHIIYVAAGLGAALVLKALSRDGPESTDSDDEPVSTSGGSPDKLYEVEARLDSLEQKTRAREAGERARRKASEPTDVDDLYRCPEPDCDFTHVKPQGLSAHMAKHRNDDLKARAGEGSEPDGATDDEPDPADEGEAQPEPVEA